MLAVISLQTPGSLYATWTEHIPLKDRERGGSGLLACPCLPKTLLSWRNKGQEAGRVEQLIEDLWLTEYADLCTVIDHDPHTALGYIFAFREKKEKGGWLLGGGGVKRVEPEEREKTARGEYNGEKNALAN